MPGGGDAACQKHNRPVTSTFLNSKSGDSPPPGPGSLRTDMTFRSLMRRREIGANSYLIDTGRHRYILDTGMHPKEKGLDSLPNYNLLPFDSADGVLITHAHHDHIGSLPVAQRRHPKAPVFMTEATGEVGSAMLHNSVNVMSRQREEQGVMEYPLFTHREVDETKPLWNYRDVGRSFSLPGGELECDFFDAGHIIGSVGIRLRMNGKSVFYTGDVNFEHQTILKAADFPTEPVDVLIVETTRGDHQRPAEYTRRKEKERLAQVIRDTFAKNGSVLMPVFALGKSQELLVALHEMRQMNLIPHVPVFIGGLSAKITVLYDEFASRIRRNYEGFRILEDMDMLVAPRRQKKELALNPQCIYALSSGMMSEGTASNKFAERFIGDPRNTVAFVGYTDPETPGAKIRSASPGDLISLDSKDQPIKLNCRVESFDFSAHGTRETIYDYIKQVSPKKVLLVHGDELAMQWFADQLANDMPATEVTMPVPGESINLW